MPINLGSSTRSHWTNAGLTFLLTVLGAGILLPLVRVQPETVHTFFNGLNDWLRISFIFFLCVVFTAAMFNLLSPRIGHLKHWKSYPPAWLAALVAWILVAIVDVVCGFDQDGYRATACEWLCYGGGSFLIVSCYSIPWLEVWPCRRKPKTTASPSAPAISIQDIENAPWDEIETWLRSNEPARYDFLDNQTVADRVSRLIAGDTHSVGIVGPYGAGKTSLINWVMDRLDANKGPGRRYFQSYHSCWGFETSASSIHDMLASAVSRLSTEIDTFQVDSLPNTYRHAFTAGGDWVETVSMLVLRNPDPMEQFKRLSDLLEGIGGRMVFIVEDLDRNETQNFEIQEVLGFLERLKSYSNLRFVLTGGLSSSRRIDYAKLCDHIEYLKTIQPNHVSRLIARVIERCSDTSVFPNVRLPETSRNYDWNPLTSMIMRDYEELSLPQAVASLLNTPRALRHALDRTHTAWKALHGELDLNHLLGLSVMRLGAPECFQFLIRRWDRLNAPPSQRPTFGQERIEGIRQAIVDDWNRTTQNVEWNPAAALQVLEFILPATEYWLVDSSRTGQSRNVPQGIYQERYWRRAVNESIDANDIRDQQVIDEVQDWIADPRLDSSLVDSLCSSARFCDVWQDLAGIYFVGEPDQVLLLCEHVLARIRQYHGSNATSSSQGFEATCFFAARRIALRKENAEWLKQRISEACLVSLELVSSLWHFWATGTAPVHPQDRQSIRQHAIEELRRTLTNGNALISRLHPQYSATLYQLVSDPGNDSAPELNDIRSWTWLGPVILEALRIRNVQAIANCGVLLGARVSGRARMSVDIEVLNGFFGESAAEVIDILDEMVDQIPEHDQLLVRNVVGAARQHFAGTLPLAEEAEGGNDAD
jgi:hypothetical protein